MSDVADISIETIIARLRELAPTIRAEGVTRLAVFGSRVRGDARPDSDLDILIETFDRSTEARRFDLFKVMHMIEDATGIAAHVILPSELTPRIRERMADDLIEVF
jgi:predicted nucleotidyltransferase